MSEEQDKKQVQEIDLIEVARKIWAKRKLVFKNCCIAAVVGVIVAFSIPKEYETKVTLAPEIASGKNGLSGSLGSLASLAGINLGNMTSEDAISPELYPDILKSTPFLVELFNVQVETKKGDLKTTLYDYMDEHQKSPWFGYVISAPFDALGWVVSLFKDDPEDADSANVDYFDLTLKQAKIAKSIQKSIIASVDKKSGVITLKIYMQDPLISAALADTVKDKLQQYIINYRTNKARKDLLFTEKMYEEALQNYIKAQQAYATHMDGNLNVVLERFKTEEERLGNEVKLAYQVYGQVAQQLQLAKAKVQEQTPVYTVVQPAVISLKAASPRKIFILIVFMFLAGFGTIGWIFMKDIFYQKIYLVTNFFQAAIRVFDLELLNTP